VCRLVVSGVVLVVLVVTGYHGLLVGSVRGQVSPHPGCHKVDPGFAGWRSGVVMWRRLNTRHWCKGDGRNTRHWCTEHPPLVHRTPATGARQNYPGELPSERLRALTRFARNRLSGRRAGSR
jgi:hypothetical protein